LASKSDPHYFVSVCLKIILVRRCLYRYKLLFACVVLRQSHSVALMTRETGVEPLTQHTDREYGMVAVDWCRHFRSLLSLITRHTFLAVYGCCRQELSSSWRTARDETCWPWSWDLL